jgi:putative flippase GtrA
VVGLGPPTTAGWWVDRPNRLKGASGSSDPDTVLKLLRYAAVSAVGVVITQTLLVGLHVRLGWSPTTANVWAVSLAAAPAYLLNRRWVWRLTGDHSFTRELLPFWASAFAGLLLSTVAVAMAAEYSTSPAVANVANLGAFGSLWVAKFVWLDRLLFAPRLA